MLFIGPLQFCMIRRRGELDIRGNRSRNKFFINKACRGCWGDADAKVFVVHRFYVPPPIVNKVQPMFLYALTSQNPFRADSIYSTVCLSLPFGRTRACRMEGNEIQSRQKYQNQKAPNGRCALLVHMYLRGKVKVSPD